MRKNKLTVMDHPMIQEQLTLVRDKRSNQVAFREAICRLGRLMAYEFLRTMEAQRVTVETPLGRAVGKRVTGDDKIVIIMILRAAIPFVEGMYESLPLARTGIVSAWRGKPPDFRIEMKYAKLPEIHSDDIVIIADPMLATGHTLRSVAELVLEGNRPRRVVFFSVISTQRGIDHVAAGFPNAEFYTCAVDPELDNHGYIVPGLGDAGDRALGVPH